MQSSGQVYCLFAISIGLCICFVWALYEFEEARRRRDQRVELVRDATRFVVPRPKARS